MELATFGAVLKFAIEFEDGAAKFYKTAAETLPAGAVKDTFLDLAKLKAKRKQITERARQDNVTEMILEPISGLRSEDFIANTTVMEGIAPVEAIKQALALEDKAASFYAAAAEKLSIPEVVRIFKKLGAEIENHKEMLIKSCSSIGY